MRHYAGKSEIRFGEIVVAAFHKKGTPLTGDHIYVIVPRSLFPLQRGTRKIPLGVGALIAQGRGAG